jgi:hypothetical protein
MNSLPEGGRPEARAQPCRPTRSFVTGKRQRPDTNKITRKSVENQQQKSKISFGTTTCIAQQSLTIHQRRRPRVTWQGQATHVAQSRPSFPALGASFPDRSVLFTGFANAVRVTQLTVHPRPRHHWSAIPGAPEVWNHVSRT